MSPDPIRNTYMLAFLALTTLALLCLALWLQK